jgi:DUF1365 family protein
MTGGSAIYRGRLAHARHTPRPHAFTYDVWLLYLELDQLPELLARSGPLRAGRFAFLSFRREDYLAGRGDLAEAARARVEAVLGFRPAGPVRLLTQVRSLGRTFNPVSFYYCFGDDGRSLQAVVAEVTNTPWGERHAYVVPAGEDGVEATVKKAFHVSPFFGLDQDYAWRLSPPGERLVVEMRNHEGGGEVFRARLDLRREPWSAAALWRAALGQPLMAWRVAAAIYWQALRLWLKRTPFHPHPASAAAEAARRP